ncbi:MAG: hypothetical protein K0R17_2004 [Rariglobus sp.]|jgi:lysophospholipase L1-like esterase|nr:hypothetical protein [Rariglobus sp.]
MMAGGVLHAQNGPTPYPDSKDDAAWPGRGPIRTFNWMVDNRAFFWTQRDKAQNAVVFVGDSLVGNWKGPLMSTAFPKLKVANRGIGGDVTRGVLFRFKEDVLDLNPRAVVICVGTNDLSTHAEPAVVAQNISLLLDQARDHNPAMPVVVCTVPPRANPKAPLQRANAVTELNTLIRKFPEGRKNVVVFDLFAALATPEGAPKPEYFNADLLHPAPAGYVQWGTLLAPVLASLHLESATPVTK